MDIPTAIEARTLSKLLEETFPAPDGDAPLVSWLAVAGQLVGSLTGRSIPSGADGEEVPAHMLDLANRVIVMKAEGLAVRGATSRARTRAAKGGNLQSISAGPWSETYFGPQQAAQSKRLDPDQDLHDLLWALATDEARGAWEALWSGEYAPAAAGLAFEYQNRPGAYGYPVPVGEEYLGWWG